MERQEIKTTFLLNQLKESHDLYHYIQNNQSAFRSDCFADFLNQLIERYHLSKGRLVTASGLSKSYAYEIFAGFKVPTRDKILQLILSIHSTLDESQHLIVLGGYSPLSPKVQRDAAVIFGIEHQLSLVHINDLLYDLGLDTFD